LIDESHNFRNEKANRYLALDTIIQLNGGRGRDGDRKKVILLSATPIIKAAYPNATIKGKPVVFPDRKLHSVSYSLGSTYGGLYNEIVPPSRASLSPRTRSSLTRRKKRSRMTRIISGKRGVRSPWPASSRPGFSSVSNPVSSRSA